MIESERTKLRRLRLTDFENMRTLETNPEIMRFTPSKIPQSEDQTRKRLESQISKEKSFAPLGIWVAETKENNSFVGWFMLIPAGDGLMELGFMITQNHWGQGLATEVCRSILAHARAQGIREVTARTTLDNARSIRVLEKLGFKFVKNISAPENNGTSLKVFNLNISGSFESA